MVSQMRENQGGFGVTDEGDLVSQMRGLPFWSQQDMVQTKTWKSADKMVSEGFMVIQHRYLGIAPPKIHTLLVLCFLFANFKGGFC